jgi:hypothetical protein
MKSNSDSSADWSATLRGTFYFKPLALVLALLLMLPPVAELLQSPQFQAQAQGPVTDVVVPKFTRQAIVQPDLLTTDQAETLYGLEHDAVLVYLAMHGLPVSDYAMIYNYGRGDLRDEIRGIMLEILIGLVKKGAGSTLTGQEKKLYDWFHSAVSLNEFSLYDAAVADKDSYKADPCAWTPDADVARAMGLHYDVSRFCAGNLSIGGPGTPPVPSVSYFLGAAFKRSYGSGVNAPGGAAMLQNTLLNAFATAAAVGVVIGVLAPILAAAYVTIFTTYAAITTGISAGIISAGTLPLGAAAVTGAAAVLLPLMMAAVGVVWIIQIVNYQDNLNALDAIDTRRAEVIAGIDILSVLNEDIGPMKFAATLGAYTLPMSSGFPPAPRADTVSTRALPLHDSTDPVIKITKGGNTTTGAQFTYTDWENVVWTVTTSRGWFVRTSTQNGQTVSSIGATLKVAGMRFGNINRYLLKRTGNKFIVVDAEPAPSSVDCALGTDGFTHPAPGTLCKVQVTKTFELVDGVPSFATIEVVEAPRFTSGTTANFNPKGPAGQTFPIRATSGFISMVSGTLPPGMTFSNQASGIATLTYNPPANATAVTTDIALRAIDGSATGSQVVRVIVATSLGFLSANSMNVTLGVPASFTVTGSGPVPLILSAQTGLVPPGMTFVDNGNGTGTLSGIPTGPPGCVSNCLFTLFSTATNVGVQQAFKVNVSFAPAANYPGGTPPVFIGGIGNNFVLTSTGAITGVHWFPDGPMPPWLSLSDSGNGTALLSGTPPAGTNASFLILLRLATDFASPSSKQVSFNLTVASPPSFTSPNTYACTLPGNGGSAACLFDITTNHATGAVALMSRTGALPPGIVFTDLGSGKARLAGTVPAGSGGVYPLNLTSINLVGGASQAFYFRVHEPPTFTSADSVAFMVGVNNNFAVKADGFPKNPDKTGPGATGSNGIAMTAMLDAEPLPTWLHFDPANPTLNSGVAILSGTPPPGSEGVYALAVFANNGVGSKSQLILLNVVKAASMREQQKLIAQNASGTARQGSGVALALDGKTAIVGAPGNLSDIGAAFGFKLAGGLWSEIGLGLKSGIAEAGQQGASVAVSADGATALMGAPMDRSAFGHVRVFNGNGSSWTEPNGGNNLFFTDASGNPRVGTSVAISGDGNTAIVGGPRDASNKGAAWVFTRTGGVWSVQGSKLAPADAGAAAQFGQSVALSEDGNTATIGGPGDGTTGAVWVYTRSGVVWTQQQKLNGTGAAANSLLGNAVAISADGATIAAGGRGDNGSKGAVWIFALDGGVWSQQGAKLTPSDGVGVAPLFGASVGLSGNGNLLVAGGPFDNPGADSKALGATWFFERQSSVWSQRGGKVVLPSAVGSAGQGSAVALSRDGTTALTGGMDDDGSIGAAWVLNAPDLTISLNGNFAPGSPNGAYDVAVSNVGAGPTSGETRWTATLPAQLRATSVSGPNGWTCSTEPVACFNLNPLAAGATAFFTMNVEVKASGSGTTEVAVSGLDINTQNNSATHGVTIGRPTPTVSWAAPAAIAFGTALGAAQLNAVALNVSVVVPGTFTYTPPAGTVLPVGSNILSVTFTPTDGTFYNAATGTQTIQVNAPPAAVGPAKLKVTQSLARVGGNVIVTVTIANSGGAAQLVKMTAAKIGNVSGTPLPQNLGTIAAGTTLQTTATFPGSVGAAGASGVWSLTLTYTGGAYSGGARIVLP